MPIPGIKSDSGAKFDQGKVEEILTLVRRLSNQDLVKLTIAIDRIKSERLGQEDTISTKG